MVLSGTWKIRNKVDLPLVEEDQIRESLNKLAKCKSMGPGGIHP